MVKTLIEQNDAFNGLQSNDKVLIKPNLVVSRGHWVGINTDPQVVEAIVVALKEYGAHKITVGDGAGMGYSAKNAFKTCGYNEMADRYGLKLIDLEKDRFIKKPVLIDGPFKSLEVAKSVVDSDFLINVPLMKAHGQTLITCSLKNLKGVMPRAMKTRFHSVDIHQAIAQLASVVSPQLIIVDGLQGDLMSETGRTPVQMERILIGHDPVAVDSVVADMLGYAPRKIRHIAHSADADLGSCELEKIQIKALNRPTKTERFTAPPPLTDRFPCTINADGACCTCMGNLIFALERLKENGLLSRQHHFLVGLKAKTASQKNQKTIAVGQCAAAINSADITIDECPPSASTIYKSLADSLR